MQAAGGGNVAFAEFKTSAFPYRGMIPADADTNERAKPFLDVNAGRPARPHVAARRPAVGRHDL